MSAEHEVAAEKAARAELGGFERYLTIWVALCILAGIALGHQLPAVFQTVRSLEIARVNLPVAILIWLMIVPMPLKIDICGATSGQRALAGGRRDPARQLGD